MACLWCSGREYSFDFRYFRNINTVVVGSVSGTQNQPYDEAHKTCRLVGIKISTTLLGYLQNQRDGVDPNFWNGGKRRVRSGTTRANPAPITSHRPAPAIGSDLFPNRPVTVTH